MLSRPIRSENGDTLIEVIFATAVLALIIVISLSIMTSGTAQAERAVEGTFVRQSIDSQTEMLRFARDTYVGGNSDAKALWKQIVNERVDAGAVLPFDQLGDQPTCTPPGGKGFWLQANGTSVTLKKEFATPATYAVPGNGMWITATSNNAGANYYDFYIYACWDSPGNGPKATSGTVERLYVPN